VDLRTLSTKSKFVVAAALTITGLLAWRWASGFTSGDLFFDDAWAALPARVPLGTALQMSVTTPGWTLLLHFWLALHAGASWWAQLPSFVAALASVALFGLWMRRLNFEPMVAFLATVCFACNPMLMVFATRVKPYSAECAISLGLYLLSERARRQPTRRCLLTLAVVSVLAVVFSFALVSVVAGVWVAALLRCWRDAALRREVLVALGLSAVATGTAVLPFYLNRPPTLADNWITRGYMANYTSTHALLHSLLKMCAGFGHQFFGLGVGNNFENNHFQASTYYVAIATSLLLILAVVSVAKWSPDDRRGAVVAPTVALIVVVLGAMVDVFPLGDGRTDLVLYPAVVVLFATGVEMFLAHGANRKVVVQRWTRVVVALVVVALSFHLAFARSARYPETHVSSLWGALRPLLRPGDVIVLPPYLAFTWADAEITPTTIALHDSFAWPQGFRPVSLTPEVFFPERWKGNDPRNAKLSQSFSRVWYIGYTVESWNPYAVTPHTPLTSTMPSYTRSDLTHYGWVDTPHSSLLRDSGVYAELLVHPNSPH